MFCGIAALLAQNPIFKHLSDEEKAHLSLNCSVRTFSSEQSIFTCGDTVKSLFVILKGRVLLNNYAASGQLITYSISCVGDMIGHTSIIEGICHITNATAFGVCEVLVINKDIFLELFKKNLTFATAVATFICAQQRYTLNVIDDICCLDMPTRLAKLLLTLGRHSNTQDNLSSLHVSHISQNILADIIGSSRQSVNRVLRDWENDGIVILNRAHIILCNKGQLEEIATSAALSLESAT